MTTINFYDFDVAPFPSPVNSFSAFPVKVLAHTTFMTSFLKSFYSKTNVKFFMVELKSYRKVCGTQLTGWVLWSEKNGKRFLRTFSEFLFAKDVIKNSSLSVMLSIKSQTEKKTDQVKKFSFIVFFLLFSFSVVVLQKYVKLLQLREFNNPHTFLLVGPQTITSPVDRKFLEHKQWHCHKL